MDTTVTLQEVFNYPKWMFWTANGIFAVAIILLIYAIACIVIRIMKKKKKPLEAKPQVRNISPQYLYILKGKYGFELNKLASKYSAQKISKRDAYQKLSGIIRKFIHEATGINVENYTAKEVKALGIRNLNELMEEYYVPEFAEDEKAANKDFLSSCNIAAGVIRTWS